MQSATVGFPHKVPFSVETCRREVSSENKSGLFSNKDAHELKIAATALNDYLVVF